MANGQAQFGMELKEVQQICWNQSLGLDSRYRGPCPAYLEHLESSASESNEQLLAKLYMRHSFSRYEDTEYGEREVDTFKMSESINTLNQILAEDPDNFGAAYIYALHRYKLDTTVESLDRYLDKYERDPACPFDLYLVKRMSFGHLNEIFDNWLAGNGSGSELTDDELRRLIFRVRESLLTSYEIEIAHDDPEESLFATLASFEDAILKAEFDNAKQVYAMLGVDYETELNSRRSKLIASMSNEFSYKSTHGRTHAFRMVCNSYGFAIGLMEHCNKLINRHGSDDLLASDHPKSDWVYAAILVVDALTRDCSEVDELMIHHPYWLSNKPCFPTHYQTYISDIKTMLAHFGETRGSAKEELLRAYLSLNESSDEHFLRAMAQDELAIVHGARLAKRLLKIGETETAANIVFNIEPERIEEFDSQEQRLFELTLESVQKDAYGNWYEGILDMF